MLWSPSSLLEIAEGRPFFDYLFSRLKIMRMDVREDVFSLFLLPSFRVATKIQIFSSGLHPFFFSLGKQ